MNNHLHIIWTNADPETTKFMVMTYAINAMKNKWWDKITVVAWGSTQKLLCEDASVIEMFNEAKYEGVEFSACISCANNLGLNEKLNEMGVEVKRWGANLTELIKSGAPLITI